MAESDRAAVHIQFFGIELELPRDGDRGYGESFIELDEINILTPIPASLDEQFFDRFHRRHHYPLGFDAADGLRHDACNRLFPEPRVITIAGNNQCDREMDRADRS